MQPERVIATQSPIAETPTDPATTAKSRSRSKLRSPTRTIIPPPLHGGWFGYFDRGIRDLLAKKRSKVPDRFRLSYCGEGRLGLCRSQVWTAIEAAADRLTAKQGTSDPAAWRASASADQFM